MSDTKAWHRRPKETAQAYDAFCYYYRLPPTNRSIEKAFRAFREDEIRREAGDDIAKEPHKTRMQNVANEKTPSWWGHWSTKNKWVARALAHDEEEQAEIDREWAERKRQWREANWQQGQAIRQLVADALPEARQFIRSRTIRIGEGEGAETIRIMAFDVSALVNALEKAAKLQGQAVEAPSERVLHLFGASLDDTIESYLRELAGMDDPGKASPPPASSAKD